MVSDTLSGQGGYDERTTEYTPRTQPIGFSYFGFRVLGYLVGFDAWNLMDHLDKCVLG